MTNSGPDAPVGPGRMVRHLHGRTLTARRAGQAIALVTVAISVLGGVLMRIVDPEEFPNVWLGLWWAVQTVTTVGYGDVTPTNPAGRVIAAVVMVSGIGFLTVVTATITALFLESLREQFGRRSSEVLDAHLDRIDQRLQRIESALSDVPRDAPPPEQG